MRKISPPIPIGSKRRWSVQAPWILGGSQKHDVANQASVDRVVSLALTASQKTSDEVEGVDQARKEILSEQEARRDTVDGNEHL